MNLTPERTVHCGDAVEWLKSQPVLTGCSLVGSLPDRSEFPKLTLGAWADWFTQTAALLLSRCPDDGVTFFCQSDIKVEGTWVDKAYLCQRAAAAGGHALLFHKIICRAPAGTPIFGRPSYSHLLCFSKGVRMKDSMKAIADVIPETGDKTWARGMGLETCLLIARFVQAATVTRTLVNPFCGEGSVLAAANAVGLNAVGIERSPKRTEKSRQLRVTDDQTNWVTPRRPQLL